MAGSKSDLEACLNDTLIASATGRFNETAIAFELGVEVNVLER